MASRTSIYTNALKLPDWVFGADYGDLSKTMNARDMGYEQVQQQEQLNDQRQYQLDALQREDDLRQTVSERLGNTPPANIRDAYQQMIDAAYEAGDPIAAINYQTKRDAYDQNQLTKQRAELSGAISAADNLSSYEQLQKHYKDVLSPEDWALNQKKKRAEKEPTYWMRNNETGEVDPRVPLNEAKVKQKDGWQFLQHSASSGSGLNISGTPSNETPDDGTFFGSLFGGKPGDSAIKAQVKTVENLEDKAPGKGAENPRGDGAWNGKQTTWKDPKTERTWKWNSTKKEWE